MEVVLGDHLSALLDIDRHNAYVSCEAAMHLAQSHSFHPLSNPEPFEHDLCPPADTLGTIWINMVHLQLIQDDTSRI